MKKPATHRVIWLFNPKTREKFDLQAPLFVCSKKMKLVVSLLLSLNNVKFLVVNLLIKYGFNNTKYFIYLLIFFSGGGEGGITRGRH